MEVDFEDDTSLVSDENSDTEETQEYEKKIKQQEKVETLTSKLMDKWSEDLTVSSNPQSNQFNLI